MKYRVLKLLIILALLASSFFAADAMAQSVNIDLGKSASGTSAGRMIQLVALITIISLAPSILVMVTSFTRIVVVLAFVRSAIGLQTTPPNQVIISLSLFLTMFVMQPTFEQAWHDGIQPLMNEKITEMQALERTSAPFHGFMLRHVRDKDLNLFLDLAHLKVDKAEDTPWRVLMPAFMISELKRAFEIGFLIFVPFIIIDMLVASILMAMGMMMLPPATIALPFKLIFFVMVDGWYLVCGSLVRSFGAG